MAFFLPSEESYQRWLRDPRVVPREVNKGYGLKNNATNGTVQESCEQDHLRVAMLLGSGIGFHELSMLVKADRPVVDVAAERFYDTHADNELFIDLLDKMVTCTGRPRKWIHLSVVRDALWIAVRAHEMYPALGSMREKIERFWQHEKDKAKKRAEKEAASEQQVATTRPSTQLTFQAPALASAV